MPTTERLECVDCGRGMGSVEIDAPSRYIRAFRKTSAGRLVWGNFVDRSTATPRCPQCSPRPTSAYRDE